LSEAHQYINFASHKMAHRFATRATGRPGLLLEKHRQVGVLAFFGVFGCYALCTVLLKNLGLDIEYLAENGFAISVANAVKGLGKQLKRILFFTGG